MEIMTLRYTEKSGWSCDLPVHLDSPQTLVLVFGGVALRDEIRPLQDLVDALPQAIIVGCSTAGEIHGGEIDDGSVVVSVVRFERTRLRAASVPITGVGGSYSAGQELASVLAGEDLRAIFVLSDGLQVNGSALLAGMNDHLDDVVVTGGLAGDGGAFESTWVISDGRLQSGTVAAVALYGTSIRVGHGSQGGWDIFGPERVITRSRDNVLFELDGRPALELYKRYLGDRAAELPASALLFPLAIRPPESVDNGIVRTILAVDDGAESMTFAGDVPEGWRAQLMRANFDRLVQGAFAAAQATRVDLDASAPCLAVAISCVGRRLVLGERADDEVEAVFGSLPQGSELVGFYSYGEISPHTTGSCELHNQTMTVTTLQEQ